MKLLDELRTVLKQDKRLVSEDKLLKNRIVVVLRGRIGYVA